MDTDVTTPEEKRSKQCKMEKTEASDEKVKTRRVIGWQVHGYCLRHGEDGISTSDIYTLLRNAQLHVLHKILILQPRAYLFPRIDDEGGLCYPTPMTPKLQELINMLPLWADDFRLFHKQIGQRSVPDRRTDEAIRDQYKNRMSFLMQLSDEQVEALYDRVQRCVVCSIYLDFYKIEKVKSADESWMTTIPAGNVVNTISVDYRS